MKKMTKIESARIMVEQKGDCRGINCNHCFCHDKCFKDRWQDLDEEEGEDIAVKYAEAYIKRHEQKSKKRLIPKYTADVQPDTTGSELKKIVMKPANTDPTPLEIAKMIRDNGYRCVGLTEVECKDCPLCDYNCGSGIKTNVNPRIIDDYIKANEPVCEHLVGDLCGNAFEYCNKECPANSELKKPEPVIEPIKFDDPVPEYVYKVSDSSIKIRKVLRFRLIDEKEADGTRKTLEYIQTNNGDCDFKNCYKTLDEAVAVAKKNWGLK